MRKHLTNRSSAAQSKRTPAEIADQIRRALKDGGSAEHATGVQWFFKDEIKSHGWYTAALRRAARAFRRDVRKEHELGFLVDVADQLFCGSVLEEKVAAVFLLQKLDPELRESEFRLFESWLDRIGSWADHDALVHFFDCTNGSGQACPRKNSSSLGEVAGSLAPQSRLRSADQGCESQDVFP